MKALDIYSALKNGDFEKMIGLEESSFFDAKDGIYDTNSHKGKYELAKDICAFANSQGGIIVIGCKVEQLQTSMKERVVSLNPITGEVKLDSYRKIILELIYPKILNQLEIEFVPCEYEGKTGKLIFIFVKPDIDSFPYFITRTLEERRGEERLISNSISIPVRQGADTSFDSPSQIHSALKFGIKREPLVDTIFTELKNIREILEGKKLDNFTEDASDSLNKRIEDLKNNFLKEGPFLILSASYLPYPSEINNIFNPAAGFPMGKVAKPPYFRYMGWNLLTHDKAVVVDGKYVQVTNGDRKVLRVYRDGIILFGASAAEDFLGHGTVSRGFPHAINAIAITEIFAEFVHFSEFLRVDLKNKPKKIEYGIVFLNPEKIEHSIMFSPEIGGFKWPGKEGCFNKEEIDKKIEIELNGGDIDFEAVAYDLLKEFFYFFGITDDKFIYIKDDAGIMKIDTKKIQQIQ